MYTYRIIDIELNDGTRFSPKDLTILVGPNNSGKSRALKDIVGIATERGKTHVIVRRVNWTVSATLDDLRNAYKVERIQDEQGNWMLRTLEATLEGEVSMSGPGPWPQAFNRKFEDSGPCPNPFFSRQFGHSLVAFLTTESRLQLVKESASPQHEYQAANVLQMLYYAGRATEQAIRELVKRAFQKEVALDFTMLQQLLVRVGDNFREVPPDPRDARPFMAQEEKLDDQGDGIRSFVGIVVAMLALKRPLFLIDEPEAFLHPPQAFRIGEFLADQASPSRQIVMATHSADILRGILSRRHDVGIVRIDRVGNTNSFRSLDPIRLKEVITDPLLMSARVLDGLFYSGAVVVEADSDARFYHLASRRSRPELDLHFVNADNKQTVPRIAKIYQDMGVRWVGIVDFDVLSDRTEFDKQLAPLDMVATELAKVRAIRDRIAEAADSWHADDRLAKIKSGLADISATILAHEGPAFPNGEALLQKTESLLRWLKSRFYEFAEGTKPWTIFKQRGRAALPEDLRPEFDQLAEICSAQGLFINPRGELESMLAEYGIEWTTDKRGWIVRGLQLLHSLSVDANKYPWKLVEAVHRYLFREP